jgi:hypothetical protein
VPDQPHPLDLQSVEQRDLIAGEVVAVIAATRRLAPAEAAKIRNDQAVAVAEPLDHLVPLVPMLGPAVQEQNRVARARLGDVDPQLADVDHPVLDPVHVRQARKGRIPGSHAHFVTDSLRARLAP